MSCSISSDRLHRIIGSAKSLIGRVPGCALHHLPLGFERFSSTRSKVFLAMAAYPASPEAMASCAKAIVAKVYEKML